MTCNEDLMQEMASSEDKTSSKNRELTPLSYKVATPGSRQPRRSENVTYYFQNFSDSASPHGLKFLGEAGRSIVERIFWAVVLTVAYSLCIYMIVQTFHKWISSPVLVSFGASQIPIFEIPFPAITICPEVKSQKEAYNYTDVFLRKYNNRPVTDQENAGFEHMSLVCDAPSKLFNRNVTTISEEAVEFLISVGNGILVAPQFDNDHSAFLWKGRFFDKQVDFFTPVLTNEGVCHSFNILDRTELFTDIVWYHDHFFSSRGRYSEWSPEEGYSKNASADAYPRRSLSAGVQAGLRITLAVLDRELDYACTTSPQGFKVTLHNPTEMPRVKQSYFRLPLDESIVAAIKPDMIRTSGDLRGYKIKDRLCYFASERKLKFFRSYNQQNCIVERLANFTLQVCKCVKFDMPREKSTPICGPARKKCASLAENIVLAGNINENFMKSFMDRVQEADIDFSAVNSSVVEPCLPACDSLDYSVEISQTQWDWRGRNLLEQEMFGEVYHHAKMLSDERVHLSRLSLYFKDMQFITQERNELYGYEEFWANVGGTVGLFTGFSFVTVFEILYYLTLRLFCNIRMFGRPFWSGDPKVLEGAGIKS